MRVALCRTCHFGFFRESEKEPLATYIQGLLSELEQLIELSKKKLKDYEKAIPKAKEGAEECHDADDPGDAEEEGSQSENYLGGR